MTLPARPRKITLPYNYALLVCGRPMSECHSPNPAVEKLESIRRSLDLRLDAEGCWWHDGRAFEHDRIIEAFHRGIDVHPDSGEPIVRIGDRWCYFTAELTPFVVRRLQVIEGIPTVLLNTGERHVVGTEDLSCKDERIYVHIDTKRVAVLDRRCQLGLSSLLSPDEEGLVIETSAGRWVIAEKLK